MMQVTVDDAGPCRKVMRVTAAAEETDADYRDLVARFAAGGRVPGFRPGLSPATVQLLTSF